VNLATFTLQVLGPEPEEGSGLSDSDKRVLANLPAVVEAVEEDMSDLLPEGYSVRIEEWSE